MPSLDGVRVVALLKLGKALLLSVTLYGAHRLLDPATAAVLTRWSETLTDRFARIVISDAVRWVGHLDAVSLDRTAVVAGAYVALVLVEAIGLWFHRAWAEWLTVVATGAFIPFELWRILFHRHEHLWLVFAVLVMNSAVVAYLVLLLRGGGRRNWPFTGRRCADPEGAS